MTTSHFLRSQGDDAEHVDSPRADISFEKSGEANTSKPHWRKSAVELAEKLQSRALSPTQVARSCLGRIAQREPSIGAWAFHNADLVLQQAHALDKLTGDF